MEVFVDRTDRLKFRIYVVLLLIVWTIGCFVGSYIASRSVIFSWMRSAISSRASIVGSVLTLSMPFVFSFILCKFCNFYFIFPFVFLKSVSFSLVLCGLLRAFGSAGWLAQILFLLPDFCCVFLLLWFWMRRAFTTDGIYADLSICICSTLLIGCIDYYCLFPIVKMVL